MATVITALHKQRGQLYLVERRGDESVYLDRKTVDDAGLGAGSTLSDEQWDALCRLSEQNRARERALWLLSQRDRSQRELENKLREKVGREAANETAARMVELGLVDDERYARQLARELCQIRHYPVRRALQRMAERGISREVAEQAIQEIDADDVQEALALLRKRCYTDSQDEVARNKQRERLIRAGFSYEAVRTAVRLLEEEGEDGNVF